MDIRETWLHRVRRSTAGRKIVDFFYSRYYITAVGLAVLLCYTLQWDAAAYAVIALAGVASLVLCHDATPCLPLMLAVPMAQSMYWREHERSHGTANIVVMVVCGVLVAAAFVYHVATFGRWKRIFRCGKLGIASIVAACGFFTCGFFYKGYTWNSMGVSLNMIGMLCVLYFVLRGLVLPSRDGMRYLAFAFTVMGLVMSATLAETYILNRPFIESGFDKNILVTGWGISNTVGPAIFTAVPLTFYMASKEERHGWLFYLAAAAMCICMVFTLCRTSLLFGAPLAAVCIVFVCCKAKCRKQMWVCTAALAAVCVAFLCWGETKDIFLFYVQNGLGDRGRFKLYKEALELFADHPVFGVGFRYRKLTNHSYLFHNTVVQMMAAGGLVGIVTYLYYSAQTVLLYVRKPTAERLFLGLTLAGIVLMSLLDNSIFRLCIQLYMMPALVFSERDLERSVWFADCPKLGKRKALFAA